MSENVRPNVLTPAQERAATLVADDARLDADIAAECGITDRQLRRWKKLPEFQERVDAQRSQWRKDIEAEGIANRQNRVDALNDIWRRLQDVIDARATDPLMQDVPGGQTGLMVAEPMLVKVYGSDTASEVGGDLGGDTLRPLKENRIVYTFKVDTAVIREYRAVAEQAAKELGQWEDKQRIDGEMLIREYVGIDPASV